jgi:hypothetical protein
MIRYAFTVLLSLTVSLLTTIAKASDLEQIRCRIRIEQSQKTATFNIQAQINRSEKSLRFAAISDMGTILFKATHSSIAGTEVSPNKTAWNDTWLQKALIEPLSAKLLDANPADSTLEFSRSIADSPMRPRGIRLQPIEKKYLINVRIIEIKPPQHELH